MGTVREGRVRKRVGKGEESESEREGARVESEWTRGNRKEKKTWKQMRAKQTVNRDGKGTKASADLEDATPCIHLAGFQHQPSQWHCAQTLR